MNQPPVQSRIAVTASRGAGESAAANARSPPAVATRTDHDVRSIVGTLSNSQIVAGTPAGSPDDTS